jgi:hypothetical protein
MLQAKKVTGSCPIEIIEFLPNPSSCSIALGFTQPLTNEYQKIFLRVRKTNNLITVYEPIV